MEHSLKRYVLITGVSGGIGAACALAFHSHGWFVIGVDVTKSLPPDTTVDHFVQCDIGCPDSISNLIKTVYTHNRYLDALVNNAAVQICKPFEETSLLEWEHVISVNLRGPFLLLQGMLPLLKNRDASIVNVSSVHALATSKHLTAYATSKGGLCAMTRSLAIEFAQYSIRVNSVLPGAVDTEMLREGLKKNYLSQDSAKEGFRDFCRRQVLGRTATPNEIAQTIYFLADSPQSSYVNGANIVVDGGATIHLSTE